MYTIICDNVNSAYPEAMRVLRYAGKFRNSRAGGTIEYPFAVSTTYLNPTQRVLFDPVRDANPFFHMFESMWILAGRNDVKFLKYLLPNMEAFSDDGVTYHGAYGYRLRHKFDQIETAIQMLKKDPDSRRVVLSIWSATSDLNKTSKDIPCNDMVALKIRIDSTGKPTLDMTVMNRSNDAIWGCYGANVVQFSILQEYIASRLGIKPGVYNQVSDSLHVYTENETWKKHQTHMYETFGGMSCYDYYDSDRYPLKYVKPTELFSSPDHIDEDLKKMFSHFDTTGELFSARGTGLDGKGYNNLIFRDLLFPMSRALAMHRGWETLDAINYVTLAIKGHTDWKEACVQWLMRRHKAKQEKERSNE